MELSAILMARAIALFELVDISPRSGLFFPDITSALVDRFNFQKFPRTIDEWKEPKGSIFGTGKLGNTVIDSLVLFNNGIQLDTHTNTEESKRIIEETLEWANTQFGMSYRPEIIKRWAYVSNLTFYSNVALLSTPPLDRLAQQVGRAVSDVAGETIVYEPSAQTIAHDPLAIKYGRAAFLIQRRLDVPFRDGKYFSEAPLSTDTHFGLLRQYEADVSQALGRRI